MGDHDGCVGEGALDVADGLFFVFLLNEAGCGGGWECRRVVHVNKLESGFHLGEKCCHGS